MRTLVATDVAARGLDLEAMSHVINFDPPDDHDTGTSTASAAPAGRDVTATGITFVLPDEEADVAAIAGDLQLHEQFARAGFSEA